MTYRKLWIAKKLILDGKYSRAKAVLYPAARSGIAEAQALLGYLYFCDDDMSGKEAGMWLNKAAGRSHPHALAMIAAASFRQDGLSGTSPDTPIGIHLLRKAARRGAADAQRNLATTYIWGEQLPRDLRRAVYWYTRAARQGHGEAQYDLACMWLDGEAGKVDIPTAVRWFTACATGEDPAWYGSEAAEFLSDIYDGGFGEAYADPADAAHWRDRMETLRGAPPETPSGLALSIGRTTRCPQPCKPRPDQRPSEIKGSDPLGLIFMRIL